MNKILILLAAAVFPACASNTGNPQDCGSSGSQPPAPGQSFALAYGAQTTLAEENLTLTFTDILEDSRCPTGVQCIWAGNARIEIKLTQPPAGAGIIELNTSARYNTVAKYQTYTVELIRLVPYPDANQPLKPSAYCAVLKVSISGGAL